MKIQFLSFTGIAVAFMLFYLVPKPLANDVISAPENVNAVEENAATNYYVEMPNGHLEWTQVEFEAFIENLTPEMEAELIKSHHVKAYLESINTHDEVVNDMAKGSLFSEVDLSKYLTAEQIANMSSFNFVAAENSTAASCNTMVSCRAARTACTSSTRFIQRWYRCTSWGGYHYEVCRSSCGGPR